MFTDEDSEYVEFHNKCQEIFLERFGKFKNINRKTLIAFSDNVKTIYGGIGNKTNKTINSLLCLLDALVEKVTRDYSDLLTEDKYSLLMDIFENRQLKQAMEYVNSQVILSTVHGAKGLEWDYVFLADVERLTFPNYHICKKCENKYKTAIDYWCYLPNSLPNDFKEAILDELSIFYVGITRASKQVFVSASAESMEYDGKVKSSNLSCLLSIEGIKLVDANPFVPQ